MPNLRSAFNSCVRWLCTPVIFVVVVALGVLPTAVLSWGSLMDRRIARDGVLGTAEVCWSAVDGDEGDIAGLHYHIDYRFIPEGSSAEWRPFWMYRLFSLEVSKNDFESIRATGKVDVLYLPDTPRFNRPAFRYTSAKLELTLSICGGISAIVLTLAWFALRMRRVIAKQDRLEARLDTFVHHHNTPNTPSTPTCGRAGM